MPIYKLVSGVPKYQTGVTKAVEDVLTAAEKSGLPYLEKRDIIKQVKLIMPGLRNTEHKVSQAIYQLQQDKKFKNPKIERVSQGRYKLLKPSIVLRNSMFYWTR